MAEAQEGSHTIIRLSDIENDLKVAASRDANTIIRDDSGLTREDKYSLMDLAEDYATVLLDQEEETNVESKTVLSKFYRHIFQHNWSTIQRYNAYPKLSSDDLTNTSIEVGSLKPAKAKRQRVDIANTRVYLGLSLWPERETLSWFWRDEQGKNVEFDKINFHPGHEEFAARSAAIRHYDDLERERIVNYNLRRIIVAARRRIVYWARHSSAERPGILSEDAAGVIEPLLLANDYAWATADMWEDIRSTLKRPLNIS